MKKYFTKLCAHDITYAGHYKKSLLRDNDSR